MVHDLNEIDKDIPVIARHDNHIGPETWTVFTIPPSYALKPTIPNGKLEFPFWVTFVIVIGTVESWKVLTNDFFSRITFEYDGGRVPCGYMASGVQREDSMIVLGRIYAEMMGLAVVDSIAQVFVLDILVRDNFKLKEDITYIFRVFRNGCDP